MFIDGDQEHPTICGTGSEDYAGSGWGLGQFHAQEMEATLLPWGSTRTTDAVVRTGRLAECVASPWEVFVWQVFETRVEQGGVSR